ncbi:MAG: acyl-CoA dehydratase activase [Oscillospiraceae bacterium]|nr:acyl-CoA dehydratase activase [Oscillospiraceae bacterium]
MQIGIDIGSTTVKTVVRSEAGEILFSSYERHYSQVREKAAQQLRTASHILDGKNATAAITGSAGLGVARASGLQFVQEVYATAAVVRDRIPQADAVIELGGEDAKIIFFGKGLEERMNGTCAGGTGAFIDQMATLLNVSVSELDQLSLRHEKIYPIASRCGVFAKSDIQPILNQGGRREDIAASIYQAVVDQTVAGLAQGRELTGKLVFLGGPLTFLYGLRERFTQTLELDEDHAVFPEQAECYAAIGAAMCADSNKARPFAEILQALEDATDAASSGNTIAPLFSSAAEYEEFCRRHNAAEPAAVNADEYEGGCFLGIDAGSTTTKLALIAPDGSLLYSYYAGNRGNPVSIILDQLRIIYEKFGGRASILRSAATGYGEELIKNAFDLDMGIVETMAHLRAAQHFDPDVDFIIDIGGQDVKCFKIHNGAIDSIMLNEACSSGCGSFIETFAVALGYNVADFAKLGLFAEEPSDLGSRCTVFMNSSVKQAQKDGASIEAISAGLSISIVKNAVYKVIRAASAAELGKSIVVQGGTFLNEAVLRAFESELGAEVTRPAIAELMGAYGAALAAMDKYTEERGEEGESASAVERGSAEKSASAVERGSTAERGGADGHAEPISRMLDAAALESFRHEVKPMTCNGCTNHCSMTINTFDNGRRYISGNRCSKPLGTNAQSEPNLIKYKYNKLRALQGCGTGSGKRGKIGIPFGLNMFENLPFWHRFFTELDFDVVLSRESSRTLYILGQRTIPSDTVCYPAKLMHGHIESLLDDGVDVIFLPCMPYNFDEGISDNNYNCPVVAYYPELLAANMPRLKTARCLSPYFGLHNRRGFLYKAAEYFHEQFGIPPKETKKAAIAAYDAYSEFIRDIEREADSYIEHARANAKHIIVVAGRPYHADPEVNHGIDELITSLGLVLITEDSVARRLGKQRRRVLNQWTYQARMYNAARYVLQNDDMQLVQLVSFGCGTDAITTDELRSILESGGKLYTQLKIDDINNLGAVRIRLRSLIAAMEARGAAQGNEKQQKDAAPTNQAGKGAQ